MPGIILNINNRKNKTQFKKGTRKIDVEIKRKKI